MSCKQDFGPDIAANQPIVTYGPPGDTSKYTAENCNITSASATVESITCTTVAGVGVTLYFRVTIGGQISTNDVVASYSQPVISNVTMSAATADTAGGTVLTVKGSHFGQTGDVPQLTISTTGSRDYTVNCTVVSDSVNMTCVVPEGIGKNFSLVVSVGGQSSLPYATLFRYSSPEITGLLSDPIATNASLSQEVTIIGRYFGPGAEANSDYSASYGPSGVFLQSPSCTIINDTMVTCLPTQGAGKGRILLYRVSKIP